MNIFKYFKKSSVEYVKLVYEFQSKNFEFCKDAVNYVGLYISNEGLKPKDTHKNHIIQFLVPQNVKTFRSLLALYNHCGEFYSQSFYNCRTSSKVAQERFSLGLGENQIKFFNSLQKLMSQAPVLTYPNSSKPLFLH
jgi:hypothetical protein